MVGLGENKGRKIGEGCWRRKKGEKKGIMEYRKYIGLVKE